MAYRPVGFGGSFGGGFGRTGGGGAGSPAFSLNPSPQRGQGAYGAVPGALGIPASRFDQVSGVLNTRAASPLISENLLRDLGGDIDIESLQNEAARFGVATGMPMTGGGTGPSFTGVRGLNRTEQELRNIRRQGLSDYLQAIQGVGALQTDPNLASQIATQNAVWASAPNPQAAAEEQMRLWQKQFDALSRGAGAGSGRSLNWAQMGPNSAGIAAGAGGAPSGRVLNSFGDRIEPFATYPALGAYGMVGPSGFAAADSFEFQDVAPWEADPFGDFFEGYDYNLPEESAVG